MESVSTRGLMVDNTMVTGLTIKCMDVVYSLGLMDESMMVSITTTVSKVLGFLPGPTDEDMKATG